jgi:hypothetical protein
MYDSIDRLKAGILKVIHTYTTDSTAINPDYIKLAQLAYDTVLQTMLEGEKEHGVDGWKDKDLEYHKAHVLNHADSIYFNEKPVEDHIAHALTRCAIIKYLEG